MKKVVLLLLLLVGVVVARSQELQDDYTDVYVLDAITSAPVEGVLAMVANREVGESDAKGRLVFSRYVRNLSPTLIFFKDGYALDSITLPFVPDTVYLKPLMGVLKQAVVTDKKVELLLRSGTENVVDFDFVDDYILVASYSGHNGKPGKLFILDDFGDTLSMIETRAPVKSLYRSCIGKLYLVSYQGIYPILISADKKEMTLGKWISLDEYEDLQRCVLFTDSTYYYKFTNRRAFQVMFALAKQGDTAIRFFKDLNQPDILVASIEDQETIIKLLASGQTEEAAYTQRMAIMWDNSAFKRIDVPLYKIGDSILIFDFDEDLIHYYSTSGYNYAVKPMHLEQGDLFKTLVIQDQATEEFYILNERQRGQDIRRVHLKDGVAIGGIIRLEKPFASNIKIRDGKIYYLWRDGKGSTTRLFIQRNTIQ